MRFVATAVALTLLGLSGELRAEPLTGGLTVERAAGAEACPDRQALIAEVEQIAGAPLLSGSAPPDVTLELRISPGPSRGFVAVIRVGGKRNGERQLDDVGPGCDVLARGLAVTLAILLEAGPGAMPEPMPVPPPSPPGPPPVPWWRRYYLLPAIDAPKPPPAGDEGIPPLVASVGAVYDSATLISDAAGVALAVDTYIPYASFAVAFVWLPKEQIERTSFHVDYAYAGARIRACARDPFIEQFGLSGCARFVAGRRTANLFTREDTSGDQNQGAYLAVGPQVEISRRVVGPFGVYADLGVDVPVLQDSLAVVDPVGGTILEDPDHPVSFDLGVGIRFWLEPPKPEKPRP